MLQVKDLTIMHKKDLSTMVENLSFTLGPGDRAAVIGEEGNGKSSVLKLIYDPALVEGYAEWSGEINKKGLRPAYLAQELGPEELEKPVAEFCAGDPAFYGAEPKTLARLSGELGLDMGIFYDERPMSSLSGGERVKLRLCLLLLAEPDILLLDEPSNDLDIATVEWLEGFMSACPLPLLYVSHDRGLLESTANMVIHLERLRRRSLPRCTVTRCGYREYVASRDAAFSRQEQRARAERAEFETKMERFRKIRDKVERDQAMQTRQDPHGGRLLKKKMHAVQSMGRRFEREKDEMTNLPEWEEAILTAFDPALSSLPRGKEVLRLELPELRAGSRLLAENISLAVTGPERVGIIGANGAGKSTLLKLIAVELLSRRDIRAAYMPQNYDDALLGALSPVELLAPSGSREDITRARTLLGSMKYKAEEMEHASAELSGGQRAKLLFLGMVLRGANVLILDEPTRNFSPLSAPVICSALADFPGAVISVSHDRDYLDTVCTRILELRDGRLLEK